MKRGLLLPCLLLSQISWAGSGFLGTKASGPTNFGTQTASGPVGGMAILQLMVALGIVLLLIRYVLPKALGKFNRRLHPSLGGIKIEESASFGGGNLYVVTARSKTMLLATTGTAVTFLADLTEAPVANEPLTFQEMLDASPGEKPVVAEIEDARFAETLARLDQLDRMSHS